MTRLAADFSTILRTFERVIRLLEGDRDPGRGWSELERQISTADPSDLSQKNLSSLLFYVEEYLDKFKAEYSDEIRRIDTALSHLIEAVVHQNQHLRYSYDRRPQVILGSLRRRILATRF